MKLGVFPKAVLPSGGVCHLSEFLRQRGELDVLLEVESRALQAKDKTISGFGSLYQTWSRDFWELASKSRLASFARVFSIPERCQP